MLLYIYLRGLYCRFQKPTFFNKDKTIQDHLGLNHKALQRARSALQEKGLITFISGKGSTPTTYQMLGTVLLPEGMAKSTIRSGHATRKGVDIMSTPIKIKERMKKRIEVFKGTSEEDRKALKNRGLYGI
ncbi:MAG: hypothetical protein HQ547_04155 [Candidatus Omnitrophica bacterium]|nr:hypothetical protein [Candidatus Omnitrophota bacterium]